MNDQKLQLWHYTFARWLFVSRSEILRHERNVEDGATLHFAQSMMGCHSWKDLVTLRTLTGLLILVAVLLCFFQVQPNTFFIYSFKLAFYGGQHTHLVQHCSYASDCVIYCKHVRLCNGVSTRACRWDTNHVQNQHGPAVLLNLSLKCQTHIKINRFVFPTWSKFSSFFVLFQWKAINFGSIKSY